MSCASPTIAIIGGGFTGACLALHILRQDPAARIKIFEPRDTLGLGLAYSTQDPAHRINAAAQRMSLYPDDAPHFVRWIEATGACAEDAEAQFPDGRLFPRRAVFGRYVAAHVAPLGNIKHIRAKVENLIWRDGAWTLHAGGQNFAAGIAVLATGHPPPSPLPCLARVAEHPGFIAEPLRPGGLRHIAPDAKVLIIGSGLTMADIVASLDLAGHRGVIHAISRRGLGPRPHTPVQPHFELDATQPATALGLVRHVRGELARAEAAGLPWQSVFDALRFAAEHFWSPLSAAERRRLLRHARPFWETHRHRLPPPADNILQRRQAAGTLRITAATLTGAAPAGRQLDVTLRSRGVEAAPARYDAVILAAGPGRLAKPSDPLLAGLVNAGLLAIDPTGQGLTVQTPHPIYLAGPLTRGTFAEIMAVPEVARQAAELAGRIIRQAENSLESAPLATATAASA